MPEISDVRAEVFGELARETARGTVAPSPRVATEILTLARTGDVTLTLVPGGLPPLGFTGPLPPGVTLPPGVQPGTGFPPPVGTPTVPRGPAPGSVEPPPSGGGILAAILRAARLRVPLASATAAFLRELCERFPTGAPECRALRRAGVIAGAEPKPAPKPPSRPRPRRTRPATPRRPRRPRRRETPPPRVPRRVLPLPPPREIFIPGRPPAGPAPQLPTEVLPSEPTITPPPRPPRGPPSVLPVPPVLPPVPGSNLPGPRPGGTPAGSPSVGGRPASPGVLGRVLLGGAPFIAPLFAPSPAAAPILIPGRLPGAAPGQPAPFASQALLGQVQPEVQTAQQRCQVVKRKRRRKGKCREGYFVERPGETEYQVWRERSCITGKVTDRPGKPTAKQRAARERASQAKRAREAFEVITGGRR